MEKTAQAVIDTLTTHLTGELITVNAQYSAIDAAAYGQAVDVPAPSSIEFGANHPIPIGDLPCVRVIPIEDNRDSMTHEILIEWFVTAEAAWSERVNLRYGEAIQNILVRHGGLDGYANGGVMHGVSFYPGPVKGSGGAFMKGGVLGVTYYVPDTALMDAMQ